MKKILISLISLVVVANVFAQQQASVVPDNKLYSKFQTEDINNMLSLSPQEIEYWNWFANNGFVVKKSGIDEAQKYPFLRFFDKDTKEAGEIEVAYDEASFNIMAYDFDIKMDKSTVYRIGDTGYVVCVYSSSKLADKYNKYLGR
jgi:hypothetical protein